MQICHVCVRVSWSQASWTRTARMFRRFTRATAAYRAFNSGVPAVTRVQGYCRFTELNNTRSLSRLQLVFQDHAPVSARDTVYSCTAGAASNSLLPAGYCKLRRSRRQLYGGLYHVRLFKYALLCVLKLTGALKLRSSWTSSPAFATMNTMLAAHTARNTGRPSNSSR